MNHLPVIGLAAASLILPTPTLMAAERTFTEDVAFLKKHTSSFTLGSGEGKIVVTPDYQGRVMTSTVGGDQDPSFGWLNYDLIQQGVLSPQDEKGKIEEHIYVFGGEERFWMGPEGGQFAIFFQPGSKFDLEHWFTPAVIDTEPFEVANRSETEAVFTRDFSVKNFTGTGFTASVKRGVKVFDAAGVKQTLDVAVPEGVRFVGYETNNQLTNKGDKAWTKEGGLLSIWILGMYKHGEAITTVIPIKEGDLGTKVKDTYFGKVPADKLVVKDTAAFFSGAGTTRSKIGVSAKRCMGIAGSYDAAAGVLNIVTYNSAGADKPYVNSMWELQDDPSSGDVINSYNDGPPSPGAEPLGPFYELETSSPGAELAPGKTLTHISRTYHSPPRPPNSTLPARGTDAYHQVCVFSPFFSSSRSPWARSPSRTSGTTTTSPRPSPASNPTPSSRSAPATIVADGRSPGSITSPSRPPIRRTRPTSGAAIRPGTSPAARISPSAISTRPATITTASTSMTAATSRTPPPTSAWNI